MKPVIVAGIILALVLFSRTSVVPSVEAASAVEATPAAAGTVVWALGDGADGSKRSRRLAAFVARRRPDRFLTSAMSMSAARPPSSGATTLRSMAPRVTHGYRHRPITSSPTATAATSRTGARCVVRGRHHAIAPKWTGPAGRCSPTPPSTTPTRRRGGCLGGWPITRAAAAWRSLTARVTRWPTA